LDDSLIIETCYKKINREITSKWDDLAEQFGFKSGEAIRSWFKSLRKSKNELNVKNDKFEIDRQIQEFRDERNYLNKTKRALCRTENMLKVLKDTTPSLPVQSPYIFIKPSKNYRVIVPLCSDGQVGEMVKMEDTAGFNTYNFDIFKKRQQKYFNTIVEDCIELGIDEAFIPFLGDEVEGTGNIYKKQKFYLEDHVVKQIFNISESNAWFLQSLNESGIKKIKTMAVCGNHGIVGYDNHAQANFDALSFDRTKLLLKDNQNIEYQYSQTFMEVVDILGFNFLLIHGDGLNKNTIENAFYRYSYMYGVKGKPLYGLLVGHFHTPLTMDVISTAGSIIVNGNFVGSNHLSTHQLQADNKPSQTYIVVEEGKGITYTKKVLLEN